MIVLTNLQKYKNISVIDNGNKIDVEEVMTIYKKDIGWTIHIKVNGEWYEIIDDGSTIIETL